MDKKNTMLLTVIAVATLLVAVVGATFAYFTASVTNSATSTAVQAGSGNAGTVVLNTVESGLKIHLTATDMANPGSSAKAYYAVTSSAYNASTNRWDTASDTYTHNILKVTATNDDANTTYTCTGIIHTTITGETGNGAQLGSLVDGDGQVVLVGLNGTTIMNSSFSLKSIFDQKFDIPAYMPSTWTNTNITSSAIGAETPIVGAYLVINDTTADQDYLENAIFTVTITPASFSCTANGAA